MDHVLSLICTALTLEGKKNKEARCVALTFDLILLLFLDDDG